MGSVVDHPLVYRRARGVAVRSGIRGAATIALGLVLIVAVVPLAAAVTGHARFVPILSGSMEPAIPRGAMVLVTPLGVDRIEPGQVIVYRIPVGDRHVEAHRVLRVVTDGPHPVVITKGDANAGPDPWMARLDGPVVWQVRAAVPSVGEAALALREPPVRVGMLVVATLLLLVVALRWTWSGAPDRRRSTDAVPRA
jgi:signal peptidase I